jgi:hypothetical protein
MAESLAVWTVIALGLITANLPFLIERPLLVLPWRAQGDTHRSLLLQCLCSLLFFGALVALGAGIVFFVGGAFLVVSSPASVALFLVRIVVVLAAVGAVLWLAGRLAPAIGSSKPFFVRLLEVLVLYVLVGVLAFSFEASLGNPFAKTWEFYAITLSLFLVMAYPGFVYRYLMRHRKSPAA